MLTTLASIGSVVPGLLVRISVVLLLAWAVQRLLPRRSSAAVRHLVWTLALAAVLLLPSLVALVPAWTLEIRRVTAADVPPVAGLPTRTAGSAHGASEMPHPADGSASITSPDTSLDPHALGGLLYLSGVGLALAGVLRQRWQLWRFCRRAPPIADGAWLELLVRCAAIMGVRDGVRLLRGGHVVPMTCGTWRPAVVIPAVADTWEQERREAVLLHELAHVVRKDCLTQAVAGLACAVAWCHPGVWWVARRMRHERELACDDRVVAAGTPARGYAGHLLDIAYAFAGDRAPVAALAMARPRQLESRMRALLDASRDRRPVGWFATVALGTLAVALTLPLAVVSAAVVEVAPAHESSAVLPRRVAAGVTPAALVAERLDGARRLVLQATQAAGATLRDEEDPEAPGTWEVRPSGTEGSVQLRMTQGRSVNGHTVRLETFTGLAEALRSTGTPVRFQLRRDAGTFVFDGVFRAGVGAGTFAFTPDTSFPAALERRGFTKPNAREQYQMARHDVGFALIDALAEQGYAAVQTADLIRAGQHGVSATYVREMGALGYKLGHLDALRRLRDHGVTPTYVRDLAGLGYKGLSADHVRQARDHGVTAEYIRGMTAAGYTSLPMPALINARDHGVTPDYVRGLGEAGYRGLPLDEVIRIRDHGVTPDYVKVMRDHGYTGAIADLVRARDHGISERHVREMAALGYAKTPLDLLIRMRDHGVSSDYVTQLQALGYQRLAPEDLITLRDHGFSADRIKRVNARAGSRLPVDALLEALRRDGR